MKLTPAQSLLNDARSLEYYRAEQDLGLYTQAAWDVLEPKTVLKWNWHHDCITEHLQAVYLGQILRLIINVYPRSLKSLSASVALPTWWWLKRPEERFLCGSYDGTLAVELSVKRRNLLESDWYQRGWGKRFRMTSDTNTKGYFVNDKTGEMRACGMNAPPIGKGADVLLIDDPHNTKTIESDLQRESVIHQFGVGWTSRLNDKKSGKIIVIMQRLHARDLTGHLLAENHGYHHLSLPSIAPTTVQVKFPITGRTMERKEGDLLHPERDGPAELEQAKKDLGSQGFQGQHQQDPRPSEGGFFKREWWKRYRELPKDIIRTVMFADCANKPGVSNDWTVFATWLETKTGYYLKSLWRKKVAYPQLYSGACDIFHAENPQALVVEDAANGVALIQDLRAKTKIPVIAWTPQGDKFVRATRAQPTVEAGNCYLPEFAPWVDAYLEEHEFFPNAAHDDQVDTTSLMCDYFRAQQAIPQIYFI